MTDADTDDRDKIEADPAEVLDPEQYNQNQRLKEIHTARKEVREALKETTTGRAKTREHQRTHNRLAEAVAFYGHELVPLMDEADWSHKFPESVPFEGVRDFVGQMGASPEADWEYTPKPVSMAVFRHLNRFAREVGLGADLNDGNDEWEV